MSVAQRPAANAVAKAAYRIEPSIRPVLAVPQRAIDPARGFATTPRRQRGELASKLQVAAEEASGAPEGVVDESKVPDFPPLANIGYPNSVVFQGGPQRRKRGVQEGIARRSGAPGQVPAVLEIVTPKVGGVKD
eukprot:354244-Chlamydomonas_euryale.AAC.8